MNTKLISCFLIILFAYETISKKVHITKVEVDIDPKYFKIWNQIRSEGDTNVIDVDLDVLEDSEEINFRINIFKFNTDHYETFYRSEVVHSCHKDQIHDAVVLFVFKESEKYGNVTTACPMKKGHYTLRGFRIDENEMKNDLPEGDYRVDFHASMRIKDHDHPVYTDKYFFTFTK